jgi:hypothetical protein
VLRASPIDGIGEARTNIGEALPDELKEIEIIENEKKMKLKIKEFDLSRNNEI